MKTSTVLLMSMVIFTIAGLIQGIACVRYIDRISDDHFRIYLYVSVLVLYAIAAAFFYFRWVKERRKE